MALQYVHGRLVYIVEFDSMPQLPIKGEGTESIYARALTKAIEDAVITEPGKYGIEVSFPDYAYHIYKVLEE